jgi:alpha-galactosidase
LTKIVIIGAGSGFGGRLSVDILGRETLRDSTIALCDTDAGRLRGVTDYVNRAIEGHGLPAKCIASTDRNELLPGADCVVTAVSVGGPAYWGEPYASEVGIPLKYGIDQSVADTIGPGGIFRFLRTAKEHLQFCLDMENTVPTRCC